MEFLAVLINMLEQISDACANVEKLPAALLSCGVLQAAAALVLALFKAPGGLFLHHGKAPSYLYYSILAAVAIFGLVEAFASFWVSGDLRARYIIGKTILCVSVLPMIIVAALGAFVILK